MLRRMLLGAFGCAAIGILACSQETASPVAEPSVSTPEPDTLTAPDVSVAPTADSAADSESEMADPSSDPVESEGSAPQVTETVRPDAEPAEPQEVVDIDPILDSVVEFYGGLQGFKVTAEVKREVTDEEGNPLPGTETPPLIRELILIRPNRFVSRDVEEIMPAIVSDGQNVTAYFAETGKFLQETAPADFSGLSETQVGMALAAAGSIQMLPFQLLADDPRSLLSEGITAIEYVGHEEIDETPAHRLQFQGEQTTQFGAQEITWEMWVASEGDPHVLQTRLVRGTQTVQIPGVGPTDITIAIVEKLHNWEPDPQATDEMFLAAVPDTAKAASDVFDLFQPPPPLLGEDAPEVNLPLFGEGELNLASHEGTDVVILDFWATWCGPCREGLPILAEVSQEYQDRGVVFYAVNLEETDEEIAGFLESEGLPLTVARDADGSVANEFGVNGIPHSVVIGMNGIVQSVHIGFSPDLGNQLRRELDALLDGKDIFDGLPEPEATDAGESTTADETPTTDSDNGENP